MKNRKILSIIIVSLLQTSHIFGMDEICVLPEVFPNGQYAHTYSFWVEAKHPKTIDYLRAKAVDFSNAASLSTTEERKIEYGKISVNTWRDYFQKNPECCEIDTLESAFISYFRLATHQNDIALYEKSISFAEKLKLQAGENIDNRYLLRIAIAFINVINHKSRTIHDYHKRSLPFWDLISRKIPDEISFYLSGASCYFEAGHSTIVDGINAEYMEKGKNHICHFLNSKPTDPIILASAYKAAARIYQNIGLIHQDSPSGKSHFFQAALYWDDYFAISNDIDAIDYGNAAQTFKSAGMSSLSANEKAQYFEKSIRFYIEYFKKLKEQGAETSYHDLFALAHAYGQACFWTDANASLYAQMAVGWWEKFKAEKETLEIPLTDDEKMHIANSYLQASLLATQGKSIEYKRKYQLLLDENRWEYVFQIGNDIYLITKSESKTSKKTLPLTIVIENNTTEEEIREKLDEELQETVVKKTEDEATEIEISLNSEDRIEAKPMEKESNTSVFVRDSKKDKKKHQKIAQPKAAVGVSESFTQYQISPIVRLELKKAYYSVAKQNEAIDQIEWIENQCHGSIKERDALKFLNLLKKYLPTSLTGHEFTYHSAHGSRGGDWDKRMTHRLKVFIEENRRIFQEIIKIL